MDEELKKQNTDCVYFLASPLTCKKGLECEYRHSEVARLNPTDCWYWLAGSCLNPSCAFRHPPLDAHTELTSESAPLQPQSSASGNKVNVPCYFYFNGFCNKGDKCSFLHGAVDDGPAWKSLKTDSAVSNAPPLENKTSAGSDAGSAPMESHPNPSEAAPYIAAKVEINPIEDANLSALGNVKDQSNSPLIPSSECDETAAIRSDTLPLRESLMYSRSPVCSDQSSDEQVDCNVEREDWLESSPGFDVLVDDKSENLEYEVDPEYLLTIDRHGRELNGPFIGYDYKDTVEYEPAYSDVGFLYEQERPYSNGNFDEERYECMRKVPGYSRERMLNCILPQKRKLLPADLAIGGWSGVDLRDRLRNGRVINDHEVTRFSRRDSWIDRIQDRYPRHGTRRLHRRLNAEVNNYGLGSPSKNGTLLDGANQQGWFRQSGSKSRQRCKERRQSKQQVHSSKIMVKSVSRKGTSNEESVMFTGPKTLAQIKEEKRMTIGNDDFFGKMGHSSSTVSQQRQVPKT